MKSNSLVLCVLLMVAGCHKPQAVPQQSFTPAQAESDDYVKQYVSCEKEAIMPKQSALADVISSHSNTHKITNTEKPKAKALLASYDECLPKLEQSYKSIYGDSNAFDSSDLRQIIAYASWANAERAKDSFGLYYKGRITNKQLQQKIALIKKITEETALVYGTSWDYKRAVWAQQNKLEQAKASLAYAQSYNPEMVRMQHDLEDLKQQNQNLQSRVGAAEDDAYNARNQSK